MRVRAPAGAALKPVLFSNIKSCARRCPAARKLLQQHVTTRFDAARTECDNGFQSYNSGAVAQLGARIDGIDEVTGSNPVGSTTYPFLNARPGHDPGLFQGKLYDSRFSARKITPCPLARYGPSYRDSPG